MSLRHRITAGVGAVTLGAVGLFTLPGAIGTAAADTCSSGVGATAQAARALQTTGYPAQSDAALTYLQSRALPFGQWSETSVEIAEIAPTAAVVAAAPTAEWTAGGRAWLVGLQESGVLQDARAAADALPGLAGTDAAQATAQWLRTQLKDMNGDQDFDHLETEGAVDFDLTLDAVLGWQAVGATGVDAPTNWLGRRVEASFQPSGTEAVEIAAKMVLVGNSAEEAVVEFPLEDRQQLVAGLVAAQGDNGRFSDDLATHALVMRAISSDPDILAATPGGTDALSAAAETLVGQECTGGGFPTAFHDQIVPTTPVSTPPVSTPPVSTTPSTPTTAPSTTPDGSSAPDSTTISLIPPTSRSLSPTDGLVLDLDSIAAGSPVSITVNGFAPYERVRIELHSTPIVLGYLQVDSRGSGTTVVTIPREADPGLHQIWVIGESSGIQFSRSVTITPSVEGSQIVVEPTRRATPDARLSATGATVSPALVGTAGGAVLLAGVGLVLWSRRRTVAAH